MSVQKQRLDVLLVNRGLCPSRQRAQALIMAGLVLVEGEKAEKAGVPVAGSADITILGGENPYVSRGGLKLEKAFRAFGVSVKDKVVIDIGASTGGFTDCALQQGAARVYAIDVGWGQLAWRLRQDPRVVAIEKTNIRYFGPENLPEKAHFACIDVSFISLAKVLPTTIELLQPEGGIIALVKPQFEAGPEKVKKGIVTEPTVHEDVLQQVIITARELNLKVEGVTYSPITGAKGNIEYFLYLKKGSSGADEVSDIKIHKLVGEAWHSFNSSKLERESEL